MGRKFGGRAGQCPVTEDLSNRLLRLPFYNELTEADQASVIAAIKSFPGISAAAVGASASAASARSAR
jgi:dTDP-4-amino-4,6-dideoxygalactose transaminase